MAVGDDDVRVALRRHWAASDANDFATEHQIYRADAVLEYPQSGERIRGRANIEASRVAQPSTKRFTVRRMLGNGDLWISELVLTYDGHVEGGNSGESSSQHSARGRRSSAFAELRQRLPSSAHSPRLAAPS